MFFPLLIDFFMYFCIVEFFMHTNQGGEKLHDFLYKIGIPGWISTFYIQFYLTCYIILDAAKRKTLPSWIREGLEKMEKEKQRKVEKERQLQYQVRYLPKL